MTTPQERADAQRQTKLKSISRQVKAGKLVVRQMTPEERADFPPSSDRAPAKDAAS
jgi:hypothetical protein